MDQPQVAWKLVETQTPDFGSTENRLFPIAPKLYGIVHSLERKNYFDITHNQMDNLGLKSNFCSTFLFMVVLTSKIQYALYFLYTIRS